jgi:adenylate cyclase
VARFDACLEAATSCAVVTDGGGIDTPVLFSHGSEVAMGKALLRASYLGAEVEQVAVWDGQPATADAGTSVDVAAWRQGHRTTRVVRVAPGVGDQPDTEPPQHFAPTRVVRALLFADVRGFSRLGEHQIPTFVDTVLGPLGVALNRFDARVRFRNSWGDGIYVVFDDVGSAAACALALQDTMEGIDLASAGLPIDLALRIGAHAGPVFEYPDPITRRGCFYGVEVTRTARIEPGTPVGDIYVTNAFAALLALHDPGDCNCQYVGPMPTAKGFGILPLYALRHVR